MSFNIGLSGLNAAATSLDVTGNNIANVGTTGFKSARAEFGDLYANSLFLGGSRYTVGSGVTTQAISQQFTQGNVSTPVPVWTWPSMATVSSSPVTTARPPIPVPVPSVPIARATSSMPAVTACRVMAWMPMVTLLKVF